MREPTWLLGLVAERSIAGTGHCLSDLMVLGALPHDGPLTIGAIQEKVAGDGVDDGGGGPGGEQGLVVRATIREDRRARGVQLTQEGRQILRDDEKHQLANC